MDRIEKEGGRYQLICCEYLQVLSFACMSTGSEEEEEEINNMVVEVAPPVSIDTISFQIFGTKIN